MQRIIKIFFLIVLFIFTGCIKRTSILDISDTDIHYFNELIARAGEEVRFFPSYDNVSLACTVMRPDKPSQGVVLFIHGLGARANLYLTMADEFVANGYIIYLLDIRGHGYSHGVSGHMPSSDAMEKDINHFFEYVFSVEGINKKYIAIGHSLGTYVWVNTLASSNIEIDALVLISGGSINSLDNFSALKEDIKYFSHINKWKAFLSLFNHDIKPIHLVLPNIPQLTQSGFIQDYGFSFFTMFYDSKQHFEDYFKSTNIPIMMISGNQDELFNIDDIEGTYNLIENNNKKLIILEGETHTSIIWSAGFYINSWLKDYFPTL